MERQWLFVHVLRSSGSDGNAHASPVVKADPIGRTTNLRHPTDLLLSFIGAFLDSS
jgi:hypothetical protein